MHKVEVSSTVNNADGSEYHYSAHRWYLDDAGVAGMQQLARGLLDHANKVHDKGGDKTARLMMVVDDGAPMIAPFDKVSKKAIREQEREFLRVANHLVDQSEQMDHAKGKGHAKP